MSGRGPLNQDKEIGGKWFMSFFQLFTSLYSVLQSNIFSDFIIRNKEVTNGVNSALKWFFS